MLEADCPVPKDRDLHHRDDRFDKVEDWTRTVKRGSLLIVKIIFFEL